MLLCNYFNLLNFYKRVELSRNQIGRSGVQVKKENEKNLPPCIQVLHKTLNVIISCCCFAEDNKEMNQNVKSCTERLFLLIRPIVLQCRCCHRRCRCLSSLLFLSALLRQVGRLEVEDQDIHTQPREWHLKFQGGRGGGSQQPKFLKENMKGKWNFSTSGRVQFTNLCGGVFFFCFFFFGTTHCMKEIVTLNSKHKLVRCILLNICKNSISNGLCLRTFDSYPLHLKLFCNLPLITKTTNLAENNFGLQKHYFATCADVSQKSHGRCERRTR